MHNFLDFYIELKSKKMFVFLFISQGEMVLILCAYSFSYLLRSFVTLSNSIILFKLPFFVTLLSAWFESVVAFVGMRVR